ncbi:MAG: glycosyltransferase [Porphyromonadaceae bacterium]|nr:glycosyltransferase [Porphyromonadaceae bacterium]
MKLCNIYNIASLYRKAIFLEIDNSFDCAWAFGKEGNGVNVIRQIDPKILKNFLGYLRNRKIFGHWYWQSGALRLLFKDFDTYLLLGEPYCLSSWIFCILAKIFTKKRVFFWSHGWYGRENLLKKLLKKVYFRLGTGVFLYGNYARNLMIKEGFNPSKLFVIHNSLAYDEQLALRKILKKSDVFKKHFKNDHRTLIFSGRLLQPKRLDMILDAMSALRSKGENYNLVLIGDGSDRGRLEQKATDLGLRENVWFYGACYDESQLGKLIYNADLCVSPGNVGLTAIHALSFGCPCITHDDFPFQGPEFEAIIPGKTGAFFSRGSVESLANAISGWFSGAQDREAVRSACYAEIDTSWTPKFQINVLKKAMCDI